MRKSVFLMFTALLVIALMPAQAANACTVFRVQSKDDAIVLGRSMEFGFDSESQMAIVPRGYGFNLQAPGGKDGLSWKAKYGFVGANAFGLDPAILDGINEAGLAASILYLPGFTQYPEATPQNAGRAIGNAYLLSWILSSFATVEEVKEAIKEVVVFYDLPKGVPQVPLDFHYIIYDAKGGSIVLEYVKGALNLYDNPIGVMTNSPTFDWQLLNLRNYINLTNVSVDSLKLGSYELTPLGQGTGLLGIPGDYTPPHRFVRATALAFSAVTPDNAVQGMNLAFHILDAVDIPRGAVAQKDKAGKMVYDITNWTTVRDLTNMVLYFRTYDNLTIRKVDLKQLDFTGSAIKHIPMAGGDPYLDVTKNAK